MPRCLGINKSNGERCGNPGDGKNSKSGYCHLHVKQATQPLYRSHAGDDSDDDDAKTVASSRSRPVTPPRSSNATSSVASGGGGEGEGGGWCPDEWPSEPLAGGGGDGDGGGGRMG